MFLKLDDVDFGIGEVRIYSGRGMYGDECLGLVVDDLSEFIDFIQAVAEDKEYSDILSEFWDNLPNVSRDSMGLSTIYYWRGVKVDN